MLEIKDLWVSASGTMILKGINLKVNEGETLAVMGPNGSGKSTLSYAIMGHPQYKVEKGEIIYNGVNLLEKTTDDTSLALQLNRPPKP